MRDLTKRASGFLDFVVRIPNHDEGRRPYAWPRNPISVWMMSYRHGIVREWLGARRCLDIGSGDYPVTKDAVPCDLMDGYDAHELPFRCGSFDAVTCLELLEHTRRPERVLSEIRRVLKPGGVLIASTPWVTPYWKWIVWPVWSKTVGRKWDRAHVSEFDGRRFRRLIEGVGFRVERHVMVCLCEQLVLARS
jgi:hypothetical protein